MEIVQAELSVATLFPLGHQRQDFQEVRPDDSIEPLFVASFRVFF